MYVLKGCCDHAASCSIHGYVDCKHICVCVFLCGGRVYKADVHMTRCIDVYMPGSVGTLPCEQQSILWVGWCGTTTCVFVSVVWYICVCMCYMFVYVHYDQFFCIWYVTYVCAWYDAYVFVHTLYIYVYIYICVCVYVCMYVYIYIYIYIYIYTHTHTRKHIIPYACTYAVLQCYAQHLTHAAMPQKGHTCVHLAAIKRHGLILKYLLSSFGINLSLKVIQNPKSLLSKWSCRHSNHDAALPATLKPCCTQSKSHHSPTAYLLPGHHLHLWLCPLLDTPFPNGWLLNLLYINISCIMWCSLAFSSLLLPLSQCMI
jgi:hypothetical protein